MSAPGAPAAKEGFTPQIYLIGQNPISQLVDFQSRTITNATLPDHEFFNGEVNINVSAQPNDRSLISIIGTGTNDRPLLNELFGEVIFGLIAGTVSGQCNTDHGIPGRRSPGEY
jgi:hypothetical protein